MISIMEERLNSFIREHEKLMGDLRTVRELNLPDCYIAAGYIRSIVWDRLCGYLNQENFTDIDVVYYDPSNLSEDTDRKLENDLIMKTGNDKWSVKNQARMHIRNSDLSYRNTEDAIAHWPETVTCIGAQLDQNDEIHIIAPYGLEDLFQMIVRRTPLFLNREAYLQRVESKNWSNQWPKLTIIED